MPQPQTSLLRVGFAIGCALLFGLPLLSALHIGMDYLGESLGYRYFASLRILSANDGTVWVPQGQLVSILQHAVYLFIDSASGILPDHLRERFNLFGYLTNGLIAACNAILLLAVFTRHRFTTLDCALIALVSLAPVYATGSAGIYYSTLPDYYHLNMVIVTASTVLFILNVRTQGIPPTYGRAALLAAFVGLAASNKITMVPIAAVALLPFLMDVCQSPARRALKLSIVMMVASSLSFVLVLGAFHGFHFSRVVPMLRKMAFFAVDKTVQPEFASLLNAFLLAYGYAYFIAAFVIIVIAAAISNRRLLRGKSPQLTVLAGAVVTGAIYIWFIFRRPAGTTFFETATALTGLSAMLIVTINSVRLRFLLTLAIWGMALGLTSFGGEPSRTYKSFVSTTSASEHKGWQLFAKAQAHGKSIVVVFPDNEYHWEDPFETLMKGLSDFPTWNITAGRIYLDTLRAPIYYRTEQSEAKPDQPYPRGATIVWFDRLDLPSLPLRYHALAEAIAVRRCEAIPIHAFIRANICVD